MIIVSQSKDTIVNFNKIVAIEIDTTVNCIEFHEGRLTGRLGKYKTYARAKEVLQEIVMLFKDEEMLHIRKSTLNNLDELAEPKYILKPVSRPKVFEMPED